MARQRDGRKTVGTLGILASHLRGSRFRIHHDTLGPICRPVAASFFLFFFCLFCFPFTCAPLFLTVNLKPRGHAPRRRLCRLSIDTGTGRGVVARVRRPRLIASLIAKRKGDESRGNNDDGRRADFRHRDLRFRRVTSFHAAVEPVPSRRCRHSSGSHRVNNIINNRKNNKGGGG